MSALTSAEEMAVGFAKQAIQNVSAAEVEVMLNMLKALAEGKAVEFGRLARLVSESLAAKTLADKKFED